MRLYYILYNIYYIMVKIRSSSEMVALQQKILEKLNNDSTLQNLKMKFLNYPSFPNYSLVWKYIYKNIKNKMCPVKGSKGKIYSTTFNFTNT